MQVLSNDLSVNCQACRLTRSQELQEFRSWDGEQCSIGFQPVPRDHCAEGAVKLVNNAGTAQSGRSIAAGYWLEAYATLIRSHLRSSEPGLQSRIKVEEPVISGLISINLLRAWRGDDVKSGS
jgi:hypothetical protein